MQSNAEELQRLACSLSLDEQVKLLSGSDFWRTTRIERLNIPRIKTTDGPNGARGEYFEQGTKAALFPCGISLAATWNTDLIHQVGVHLGEETKLRGADVLLAPTVNIHRSPLGGRNFESFSEDPFLTGKIAAAYIRGVQSQGVAATIKHFVGNEQETNRKTINSIIDERTLREIYLKPFEIAIRDSSPWALMSSYNLVNGIHADANKFILQKILREEWGFDGAVISDWTALTKETGVTSVAAGCDLEMPGKENICRGTRLADALLQGEISRADVEKAVFNLLKLIDRTKGLNDTEEPAERSDDNMTVSENIRQAGREGIVLLKNSNDILPLSRVGMQIAVIGPNANRCVANGGGSAKVNPYHLVSPLSAIRNATKSAMTTLVTYAQGCDSSKWLPLASEYCKNTLGRPGVTIEYFKGDNFADDPVCIEHKSTTGLYLWDSAPEIVLPDYSFRVMAELRPKTTGFHTFSLSSVGPGRMYLDGVLFINNWDWTEEGEAMFGNSSEVLNTIYLPAEVPVQLLVESTSETRPCCKVSTEGTHGYGGVRIGYKEEVKKDLLAEAVTSAKNANVAIVIVGLDNEWESEGYDRQTMDLPNNGSQDELIEAIVKVQPSTIVVNQSGSPVSMPWAYKVPAILQTWYQGQEAGIALADVIFGTCSPSGKLPTTFPVQIEDTPAYANWPGENGNVEYKEGLFVGYRYYDREQIEPMFAFGHGLSYSRFKYSDLKIYKAMTPEPQQVLEVSFVLKNVGRSPASETAQLYIRDLQSSQPRPCKELQGFKKVFLRQGEETTVVMKIDKYSVGYYNTDLQTWIAEEGEFQAMIGASSADIRLWASFDIGTSFTWTF